MVLFVLAVNKGLCTTFRTVLVEMAFVHELFPAHAGVILIMDDLKVQEPAFPRPCGGDPDRLTNIGNGICFSPPTRG